MAIFACGFTQFLMLMSSYSEVDELVALSNVHNEMLSLTILSFQCRQQSNLVIPRGSVLLAQRINEH